LESRGRFRFNKRDLSLFYIDISINLKGFSLNLSNIKVILDLIIIKIRRNIRRKSDDNDAERVPDSFTR